MFGKMKIFLMITALFAVSFVYATQPWEVEDTGNQASYATSARSSLPFNFHITEAGDSDQRFYAHIFRGGEFYVNNTFGIVPYFNGIKIEAWNRSDRSWHICNALIRLYNRGDSMEAFKTTVHELAHADHCAFVVGNRSNLCGNDANPTIITWGGVDGKIKEPYAMMMDAFFTDEVYGHVFNVNESRNNFYQYIRIQRGEPNNFWEWGEEKYSPIAIDMRDTFDQRAAWGNTFPVDEVDGYTIHQVRDSLINVMNFWDGWRKSLRDKYTNPTEGHPLNRLFFQYIFRPSMIDWMDPVDFPPWVPEGIIVPPLEQW